MNKQDVVKNLEAVRSARREWRTASTIFQSDCELVTTRLVLEAAVNMMSAEDVSQHVGYTPNQIRRMWRSRGVDSRRGKTLLAKDSAEALANNAEIMGIEPSEMDLTSPLAYLPMGSELRKKFLETTTSKVTELPCSCDGQPPGFKRCHCTKPDSSGSLDGGVEICMHCSFQIGHDL